MELFAAPIARLRGRGLDLALDTPRVMGVVNITPDSFSDGGQFLDPGAAAEHALRLAEEGADLIDLGAESTRPGAEPVDARTELARLLPVLGRLQGKLGKPISVDTSDPQVMREAVAAGAVMINDVRALQRPAALDVVADLGVAVCLMHMRGEPATMQLAPHYEEVISEVLGFLTQRLMACRFAGISAERCIVDPGFGFGKTTAHNLALLGQLSRVQELGAPVLVGLSRKRLIGELTGKSAEQRMAGSVAAALLAVEAGARMVRVHDVAATVDALKVWTALQPFKLKPASPARDDRMAAARALFGDD
jgi:dihydropteroate synthase